MCAKSVDLDQCFIFLFFASGKTDDPSARFRAARSVTRKILLHEVASEPRRSIQQQLPQPRSNMATYRSVLIPIFRH